MNYGGRLRGPDYFNLARVALACGGRKLRVLLVCAVATLVAAPTGQAAWKQVTASGGSSIDQVSLLRTGDGVLHVAWTKRTGPNTQDLLHTRISPSGAIGATTPIQSGWAVLENPALVAVPGGIRVFFGGIRTTNPGETQDELSTALSIDGGVSWALQPGNAVPDGAQAYGSPVAAAVLPDGTPLEAWAGSLGTWVHAGLSPATPNWNYQIPLGNYGYDTGIATDPGGQTFLAWYSNATGHLGVIAQAVAANGSPIGGATTMPGTSNMNVGMIGRTPIAARVGGGFYVAYPTGYPSLNRIRLWKVGAATTRLIASPSRFGNSIATLAGDPNGRLWVAWTKMVGSAPHVFARRSNRAVTIFGAAVNAGRPTNAGSMYRLDGSATATALDLLANTGIGVSPTTATWKTRIAPGLTLAASPARLQLGRRSPIAFTVRDAGAPVRGARVRAGDRSGLTNANGKVTLNVLGRNRSVRATASHAGYTSASLSLRVRR